MKWELEGLNLIEIQRLVEFVKEMKQVDYSVSIKTKTESEAFILHFEEN